LQQLMAYMRAAMEQYNMIDEGDAVAVGVSGGKDSVALLCALAQMRRFYPKHFTLKAITLDPCFGNEKGDYGALAALCRELDVEFILERTNLYRVVFETRAEKNPCSLCAKLRRGMLHNAARQAGCNVVALGHHKDDAAQTALMNLFNGGNFACFSPKSYLSRRELTLIRPMIYVPERHIEKVVKKQALPIVKSACPADGVTERREMAELMAQLGQKYENLPDKILNALQKGNISGWGG